MSQPKRRTALVGHVRVPTSEAKFKEAASLDAAFYVLKRLICSKPMSQLKNRTALCPVLYGSKSHERIRGLLNFETTDYPKNNGYTVEQVCIALQVTSYSVHQHSSYFIITGFIAFAIGVDLMLR